MLLDHPSLVNMIYDCMFWGLIGILLLNLLVDQRGVVELFLNWPSRIEELVDLLLPGFVVCW